jgi:hypothetical protein
MPQLSLQRIVRSAFLPGLLALATLSPASAKADLTFNLNQVFNGVAPTSTPPWLKAEFKDVSVGTVDLVLTANLNVASEFIDEVTFNIDPTVVPSSITLAQTPAVNPLITAITNTTQNAQNLTGGGALGKGFDFKLDWTSAAGVGRFDGTDVVTVQLTGTGLTASMFNFINTGGAKAFVGAHVQGIPLATGGTISGAISAVPEPSSFALIGIGISAMGVIAHRRRKAAVAE